MLEKISDFKLGHIEKSLSIPFGRYEYKFDLVDSLLNVFAVFDYESTSKVLVYCSGRWMHISEDLAYELSLFISRANNLLF